MEKLSINPKNVNLDEMIERGTYLHGHLGPFLVAGIRMGLLALEILESSGYFGIRAESDTGSVAPLSCLSDGIQIGAGCTVGKGNLTVSDVRLPRARFYAEGRAGVEITLREDALDQFRSAALNEESIKTKNRPLEDLFTWKML